jgi:hypothetical protein
VDSFGPIDSQAKEKVKWQDVACSQKKRRGFEQKEAKETKGVGMGLPTGLFGEFGLFWVAV